LLIRQPRIIALVFAGLLVGCSTTEVASYQRVAGSTVDEAYVKPDTDFSRYTRLYAHPLEIYYREGAGAPTEEDLSRMRSIFREAFLSRIEGDYEIVTEPAADALGVRASLVDLQNSVGGADVPVDGHLRMLVANGQLTFLMEMSDSLSGDVLARAADRDRATDADVNASNSSDWDNAEAAAARWAGLFRKFLDDNLGKRDN
jgi:hypothetical protein